MHLDKFAERRNLPPPAPGRVKPARDYEVDGAIGTVDVSWSQRIPGIVEDAIDRDPRYNQYPYQEGDELDEEEDMDVEEAAAADTGTFTSRVSAVGAHHRPKAEYEVDDGESTPGFTPGVPTLTLTRLPTSTPYRWGLLILNTVTWSRRLTNPEMSSGRLRKPTRWQWQPLR